jgi:hypothetical protein
MSADLRFYIEGEQINAPLNWQDIEVEMDFSNYEIQPSVSISEFQLILSARAKVLDIISQGRIFEAIPFRIEVYQGADVIPITVLLDLKNHRDNQEDGVLTTPVLKEGGRNQLAIKTQAVTFELMESKGHITSNDYITIDYVVEKQYDPLELVVLSFQFAFITLDLIEQGVKLAKDPLNSTALAAAGITGTVASALWSVGAVIINVASFASSVVAFITLGNQLAEAFVPPLSQHKAMTFRKMLDKCASYLGYKLDTDISQLSNWVYLPSNPNFDILNSSGFISQTKGTQKGIPRVKETSNAIAGFFDLIKDLCNARFSIIDGTLHFYNVDSSFWIKNSNYKQASILQDFDSRLNTEDLQANLFLTFTEDTQDVYTLGNFKGTNYERITNINTDKETLLEGLQEVTFPLALGNRKDELNATENALENLFSLFDSIINIFGGSSNLAGKVKNRVGSLKVSDNNHSVPKILYITGGKLPQNHRDLLSAKQIYTDFYQNTSFLFDNFRAQKRVFESVNLPFGFDDFNNVLLSTYGESAEGERIEVEVLKWKVSQDTAVQTYKKQETYIKNLNENYVEGE